MIGLEEHLEALIRRAVQEGIAQSHAILCDSLRAVLAEALEGTTPQPGLEHRAEAEIAARVQVAARWSPRARPIGERARMPLAAPRPIPRDADATQARPADLRGADERERSFARISFRDREGSEMVDVHLDDERLGELKRGLVGLRLLRLVRSTPGREIHALDLWSAIRGGELCSGPMPLEDARALVRRLCPNVSLSASTDPIRWLRTCALLRRLEVIRAGTEKAPVRRGEWDPEREAIAIEMALRDADYAPSGHGDGDDPVARVEASLTGAYRRALAKLKRQDPRLAAHVKVSLTAGEIWRFAEPPREETIEPTPENASCDP